MKLSPHGWHWKPWKQMRLLRKRVWNEMLRRTRTEHWQWWDQPRKRGPEEQPGRQKEDQETRRDLSEGNMVGKRSGRHVKCYTEDNITGVEQCCYGFEGQRSLVTLVNALYQRNDGGRGWVEEWMGIEEVKANVNKSKTGERFRDGW